ncbi:SLAIN motif-containing protein 2-like isoform X2 [Actinia tenebrosa]|uniref:SLAIN motif-containing protein 2-like isoform X2 n=1 Tax=Actinia tenebrosa TaxID=6105 RepID=A0A6P8HQL5_ACTTE|nr:SLAIN motif-containing protein 2-like isoform X2 [Actinia tenebrosa]
MDLRISADADIKRLREMVQKLEEKNAGLKTHDSPRLGRESAANTGTRSYTSERMNANPVTSRVAVKLHLDDVPLMNLSDVDSEEEDSWLYMSPVHPPTPAQKSVSPYKYLKGSIDHQTDLNRVRGSLMAKLESIAAQEESISRHDHQEHQTRDRKSLDMNRTYNVDESTINKDFEEEIDLQPLNISGSGTYPIRRRGAPMGVTPSKPPQTKLYKAWENISLGDDDLDDDEEVDEAPVVRRRGAKPTTPGRQSMRYQDEQDSGVVRPRGSSSTQNYDDEEDDDIDIESAPVVRRRGAGPRPINPTAQSIAKMPDDDIPVVTMVRPRGQSPQQNYAANLPSDDDEESNEGSPQMVWQGDDDSDNSGPVRPRRRAAPQSIYRDDADVEVDNQAAVVRRRSPASPKPSTDDSLVVTAVRRRGASDNQVRPRGIPTLQQGGIPTPSKGSKASRLRVSTDAEIKRRSLPQVPTSSLQYPSSYSENLIPPGAKARVRSSSPAGRLAMKSEAPVVPRQSKLVTPRRIPTPRASNSYYSTGNDQSWQDGCY